MSGRCPGCGASFQHENEEAPGFVPPNLERTDGALICRRCYRLKHYGRAEGRPLAGTKARQQIVRALAPADAVVVVTEIGDFEGGLPPPGLLPADKPVILVVNKIDLLPPKAVLREVIEWVRDRWQEAGPGAPLKAVVAISAADGTGLDLLARQIMSFRGHHHVVSVVGATSVGKTTLMRRLLAGTDDDRLPTVSRYPGTTQGATRWHLEREDLTIYDTPGFVPGDRLIDILCPACAANLVPRKALQSKLLSLSQGQAVVFGGWAAFVLQSPEERTILTYAADGVAIHRTGAVKAGELLAARPDWLLPWACAACRAGQTERREDIELAPGEDLVAAGLGWISLRGGPAAIGAALPAGVRLVRRPALFGPRNQCR